jgi:hypothetical protein
MRAGYELARPIRNRFFVTPGESPKGVSPKANLKVRSGPGIYLAHNSAKLKTFNLPKHYPVVKVRAFQPGKTLSSPASSDPLVGG